MITNYIKIAIRNLWKDRTFTALNIIGLSTAFGVAFLLGMYALFELSFDKFHTHVDSIYKVYTTFQTPTGAESGDANPIPFAEALRDEVPGVEKITRYATGVPLLTYKDKTLSVGASWADPDFFDIFSFPILEGNKENPIAKSTVALTQKTAKRLFGNENALGKLISITRNGEDVPITITAILKDFPEASSLRFGAIFNFRDLPDSFYKANKDRWDAYNHPVYIQLAAGTSVAKFEKATRSFSALHFTDEIANAKRNGAQPNTEGQFRQIHLLPFEDARFVDFNAAKVKVNKTLLYVILGIALLIVFIASINFINMSIAKSAQRLREIGMRKTLGAGKAQLFFQFWGESILVFLVSVALGFLLAILLLDSFQTLFRTQASFELIGSPITIGVAILSFLLITLIAGGYPALLMSKLGTLQALKGKLESSGKNRVRNALIVVQFGIAILLISGTLVLHGQLDYMSNKDLGFNKEQVIAFPLSTKKDRKQLLQLMRNELSGQPNIKSVSASDNILGLGKDGTSSTSVMGFDYKGREVKTNLLFVDYDYPETLDIELIKGRSFSRHYTSDSLSVVINETMARQFAEKDPLSIRFVLDNSVQYAVIGVVKDFNFQGIDKAIEPLSFFMNSTKPLYQAYVKVAPNNLSQSYDIIETAWNKLEPNTEFLGSFLDDNIDRTLQKERMMTTMISSASILAIILSCMGLFAMSLLVVTQRRKEIGIRKVVGASVSNITMLLTKDFLKLVAIAYFIATPIAWYAATQWLQGYAYKMELSFWIFIISGGIAVCIAFATISVKTLRAAIANPVKSLRTE